MLEQQRKWILKQLENKILLLKIKEINLGIQVIYRFNMYYVYLVFYRIKGRVSMVCYVSSRNLPVIPGVQGGDNLASISKRRLNGGVQL